MTPVSSLNLAGSIGPHKLLQCPVIIIFLDNCGSIGTRIRFPAVLSLEFRFKQLNLTSHAFAYANKLLTVEPRGDIVITDHLTNPGWEGIRMRQCT